MEHYIRLNVIKKNKMIKKNRFADIDTEIKNSINEILDKLKEKSINDYILFLADGEYLADQANSRLKVSPYCIDYRIDGHKDETRLNFLSEFLSIYYTFKNGQETIDDNQYRMNSELMIYTHIWESKPFLKKLYRIAHLLNNEEYNWKISVPDMGKHDFIRKDIRKIFGDLGLNMSKVIQKGFHTSLRNAFAHSEYSFDTRNEHNRINLHNYKKANWELQTVTFDEWSERFVYSAILSFHFLTISYERRTNIITEFGKDTFQIKHPQKNGDLKLIEIQYREHGDGFSFKRYR